MSKIKCSSLLSKLSSIKSTCKQSSFGKEELASIVLTNKQIIAKSASRYMAIYFDHPLENIRLPFDAFHQVISKFDPDSEVEIYQDGSKINIMHLGTNEKTKIKMGSMDKDKQDIFIIEHDYFDEDNHDLIPFLPEFQTAVKMVHPCMPKDTSQPNYECMYFGGDMIAATDGSRAALYQLTDELSSSFFVSILDAQAILENDYKFYSLHDNYIDLIGENIFTRIGFIIIKSYPDIKSITKSDNLPDKFTIDRQKLAFELSKASLFASGEYTSNSSIELSVSPNAYRIKSQNELGKINASGPCESTSRLVANINPVFLLQSIELLKEDSIDIKWSRSKDGMKAGYQFFINSGNYHFSFMSYVI